MRRLSGEAFHFGGADARRPGGVARGRQGPCGTPNWSPGGDNCRATLGKPARVVKELKIVILY